MEERIMVIHDVRHALIAAGTVAAVLAAPPAQAQTRNFNVPSQDAATGVAAMARQADAQILVSRRDARGKRTREVKGAMTVEQALAQLLRGSGLIARKTAASAWAVVPQDKRATLQPAPAPTPGPAIASADTDTDANEIIVTATHRSEKMQDVPASIQALEEKQLQRLGADDFADYGRTVAGLSFSDRGPSRNQIVIRGITTGVEYDTGKQSTVAVYIDEVPVTEGMAQPDLKLFDVDRIEVLRGPQGTLYGSGSLGGTVRIITAQPDSNEFVSKGEASLSSTRHGGTSFLASAALNAPLVSDVAALRVVGYYRSEAGYIDNTALGDRDVNDEHTYGFRAALRLSPTERLNLTATVMHQKQRTGGLQEAESTSGALAQFRLRPETGVDKITIYNFNAGWDAGFADLVSSSSFFRRSRINRYDNSAFPVFDPLPIFADNFYKTESFTQEVRLASQGKRRLGWLIGAFYQNSDGAGRQATTIPGAALAGLPDDEAYNGDGRMKVRQQSVFGEVNFEIVPRLTFTTGLRYSKYKLSATNSAFGFLAGGTREAPAVDAEFTTDDAITPKFNLSYKATDGLLFYSQVAKGFRIGGVNFIPPSQDPDDLFVPRTFGSDRLWNYEVGAKASLAPGVTLNGAMFYIDWTDIQISQIRESDGSAFIGNAGSAVSKGVELELAARPVSALELALAATYNDARVTEAEPAIGAEKNERIPGVAKWTASGSAQYSFPLGTRLDGYIRGDLQFVGKSYNNFVERDVQGNYALFNLRAGAEAGPWEVSVFANNLFDRRARLFVDRLLLNEKVNVNRPRTFGVVVRKRY
jgi:iron complex outermembrane receptor protein